MRKSLLFAALIAALAVLVSGGTLANPQEEEEDVAQTSGGVGQFNLPHVQLLRRGLLSCRGSAAGLLSRRGNSA